MKNLKFVTGISWKHELNKSESWGLVDILFPKDSAHFVWLHRADMYLGLSSAVLAF